MSNAISDFFGKYHAVRGDDAGPQWSTTPEANLLDWYSLYRGICNGWHKTEQRETTATEKAALMPMLLEIETEILRRDSFANKSDAIYAAALMVRAKHAQ